MIVASLANASMDGENKTEAMTGVCVTIPDVFDDKGHKTCLARMCRGTCGVRVGGGAKA